jgi:hypothetical protein
MPGADTTRLEPDLVRRRCGDILDWKVDAIVASGATLADLEIALAWLAGADDVMGEARAPLSGAAGRLYDLLAGGEDFAENDGAV